MVQVYVNRINPIFASPTNTLLVRFIEIQTGELFVAGAIIHRILGLLVLLGLSIIMGGGAHAGEPLQKANTYSAADGAAPSCYITARTGAQEQPACMHALEHSHESCRACGTLFVMRSTGRLRTKFQVTRNKPNNFLIDFQHYPPVDPDKAFLHLTNGSLSQALPASADIFARTGRLRI